VRGDVAPSRSCEPAIPGMNALGATGPTARLIERARRFLCNEAWNIGVVRQTADDIVRRGITGGVSWLAPPARFTMLADPSCRLRPDGGATWFAEYLDYRDERGEIWAAEMPTGADPDTARFAPMLAEPFHMSYPTPFADDSGAELLTAEIWPAEATLTWTEQDGGWRRAGILFPGRPAVDPTLWRGEDRWWLFCTFRAEGPNDRLYLFHAKRLDDPWTPHRRNPVKIDPGSARPAGPIFKAGDVLVRPGQDCSHTYGGAVVLHAIRRLDEDEFEEETIRRLEPVAGPYSAGLHTIAPAGDVTLIDGKRWEPDPMRVVRKLKTRIGVG
jgi:hypothetical protein